ncbi:MAG: HAD-IA family hydrolase [Candidatus Coatesbacteria bacterium]|nr:HAD-IA family hydrolase [Candidatus Coatesbacteria bacterium]
MGLRAVIFDLYGTLIDLFEWSDEQDVLARMADILSLPAAEFQKTWTETYPELVTGAFHDEVAYIGNLCDRLGAKPGDEKLSVALAIKHEFTSGLIIPRSDAEETLNRLRAAGLKLALLTNCSPEVPGYWNRTALAPLMDAAIFSFQVGCKKPDPRIYNLTCERLGVGPEECVFVGDGGNRELEAADEVGMTSIMIRTPEDHIYNPRRTASDGWAGRRIAHLMEVAEIAIR